VIVERPILLDRTKTAALHQLDWATDAV